MHQDNLRLLKFSHPASQLHGPFCRQRIFDRHQDPPQGRHSLAHLDHALRHRVLLLECDGIGIDVGFAGFDYEIEMMRRASAFEFLEGLWLRTCSAEDLVVMKAFASRPRDWEDIRGILIRQEGKLDWALILSALGPLAELKEDPAILPTLETLRRGEG